MQIQEALDALENLIKPVGILHNFEVIQYSQTQDQRGRAWQKEMLLIHFAGANFSQPNQAQKFSLNECSPIQQQVTYNIELVLHSKLLRNDRSTVYEVLESILDAISGQRLSKLAGPLSVGNIDFRELKDSKFYLYGISCSFSFKKQYGC